MAVWYFNRGEWSEAYVFLKLLGIGRIYGATADLRLDPTIFMDIVEILRPENKRDHDNILKFKRTVLGDDVAIEAEADRVRFAVYTPDEMLHYAESVYDAIRNTAMGQRKFSIPETQSFLEELRLSSPKAPPMTPEQQERYGAKSDIILTTLDSIDHTLSTNGYSIKSHMGHASTLLNFSDGSNMVYKVVGCSEEIMHRLNAIEGQVDMIAAIRDNEDLSLSFLDSHPVYNRKGENLGCVFHDNLMYIDTHMDQILAEAVLIRCGYRDQNVRPSKVRDITNKIAQINPLHIRHDPLAFYQAKMKELLFSSFGGMTASTHWDGRKRLSGGYIDVSATGELLFYRAISDDVFTSYLFEHTFFDLPQRGCNFEAAHLRGQWYCDNQEEDAAELNRVLQVVPKKGNCAYVYYSDQWGEPAYLLNLNFQIRFK